MEVVGARAGDHVDYGGAAETDFSAEVGLLDFELLHGVDGRGIERVEYAAVLLETRGTDAVHQDVGSGVAAAVGNEIQGPADSARSRRNARRQVGEVEYASPQEREFVDHVAVEFLAGGRVLRRKERHAGGRNFNGLCARPNLERCVDIRALVDGQYDAVL